jgi:hypothetical protein
VTGDFHASEFYSGFDERSVQRGFVGEAAGGVIVLQIRPADLGINAACNLQLNSALRLPGEIACRPKPADVYPRPERYRFPNLDSSTKSNEKIDPVGNRR